jgi:hypothetical protein
MAGGSIPDLPTDAEDGTADTDAVDRRSRRVTALAIGLAALATGSALVLHIVGGLPLPLLLAVTVMSAVFLVAAAAAAGGPRARAQIVRTVAVAVVTGLAATLAYDATKAVLSQLDPSPYDPFEATRAFGRLLIGEAAGPTAVAIVGWAFHLANGCSFAIIYAAVLARDGRVSMRRGVISGIAWALLLETFQLVLYPGWMDIRFLGEFRQISFLSHIVFGLGMGLFIPAGLRWARRRAYRNAGGPIDA